MPRWSGSSLLVLAWLCGVLPTGCGRAPQPASHPQAADAGGLQPAAARLTIRVPNMRVRLGIT